jgi:hypothetical protein
MRRTPALLIALLLLAGHPARAQDPMKHELALQLLETMQLPAQLQTSVATMLEAQIGSNPEMRSVEPVLRQFFGRYFTWAALKNDYAEMYAAEFSEEELRGLIEFFRTPAGQRFASASPRLLQAGVELGQRVVDAHRAELVEMIQAAVPKPGEPSRP